ncbi:MAG: polysaccharide biosynthesis/export family protein [Hyphomicrobiales bacterium]|nr:polysaccharide biosynthesis/export family protein [Hyphomicrobiales bacterium]
MSLKLMTALILSGAVLAGCASQTYTTAEFANVITTHAPYQLASGDRLRVIVFGQDNLSNVYAVDSQGRISMPLIGSVEAVGRTTGQLERSIEARLRSGFLREPKVSVEVDAYRPFFILGEVTTSGQFPFVNGMTVQTAVAIAGGFTPRGDRQVATISRQINGEVMTGNVSLNQPVLPGDTITIRERWF